MTRSHLKNDAVPYYRTELATAELRGGVKMVTTGPETPPLLPDETFTALVSES